MLKINLFCYNGSNHSLVYFYDNIIVYWRAIMKDNILVLLENEYSALKLEDIFDRLGLESIDDQRELEATLNELIKERVIYLTNKNRYILFANCPDFRKGKLQINKSGNGFVMLEGEKDIFVSKKNIGLGLEGDMVLVKIFDTTAAKPEGIVFKVLERDLHNIVGMIVSENGKNYFKPNEERNITLTIDEDSLKKCVDGEIVVVSILDDLGKNRYIGEVKRHICHKDDANEDILTIAAKYDIFPTFSEEAMLQADSLPTEIDGELLIEESKLRRDLTDEMIFTIDGEDTKDIDDAISLKYENGYYYLKVSIADVSHYVTEGSPLDIEAFERGTSSYLAYSVLPMLPHTLSNGICSLNPNAIRCALTCEMKIDHRGNVIDSDIYPSLIRSRIKMTYTSVNHLLEENIIDSGYEEFADNLKLMQELAHIIRNNRVHRGAADFGVEEPVIICDDKGVAIDVKAYVQGEGQKLIEDFMVIANETVAKTFSKLELPSIYRVHDVPKPEKIEKFIAFASATGHNIKGKFDDVSNPKMFQSLLSQIDDGSSNVNILKTLAIRCMPKAYYSKDNIGHFGLAIIAPHNAYTHFTSPIRRYPDLQVHRLIWNYLINECQDEKTKRYWDANLDSIAKHCSERELKAVECEREVDKMKMAEYMEQHVGEEFMAIVSGVTSFGLFVQLPNLVEGLISVDSLDGGHFEYVEDQESLIDPVSKKIYRIGDSIKVKCVKASKELMQIDFEEVRVKEKDYQEEDNKKLTKNKGKNYGRNK